MKHKIECNEKIIQSNWREEGEIRGGDGDYGYDDKLMSALDCRKVGAEWRRPSECEEWAARSELSELLNYNQEGGHLT